MSKVIKIETEGKSKEEIIKIISDALEGREKEKTPLATKLSIICEENTDKKGFASNIEMQGDQDKVYKMLVIGIANALIDLNNGEKNLDLLVDFVNGLTKYYINHIQNNEEE